MEKQRNYLQSVKNEVDILPIEEEFLSSTKRIIENKVGHEIRLCKKYEVHPIYDCYLIAGNDRPFLLKVNLSPDTPNSWDLLSKNNYDFHQYFPSDLSKQSPTRYLNKQSCKHL